MILPLIPRGPQFPSQSLTKEIPYQYPCLAPCGRSREISSSRQVCSPPEVHSRLSGRHA
jgi:hypothetical protein